MDYEALGHYVELGETIEKLQQEETDLVRSITRFLEKLNEPVAGAITTYDEMELNRAMDRFHDLHQRLLMAVHEANSHANRAKRPKRRIVKIDIVAKE